MPSSVNSSNPGIASLIDGALSHSNEMTKIIEALTGKLEPLLHPSMGAQSTTSNKNAGLPVPAYPKFVEALLAANVQHVSNIQTLKELIDRIAI